MITKQKIYQDGDKICLRNTVDVSSAVDAARRVEGNQAKYQYYIQKFFSVWKQFAVNHKKRTWRGAVLLG